MSDDLEGATRALAREIAEAGASERARVYHLSWWSERVLEWAMAHPAFKTQLFRFVDVFPACRDDADVTRHLLEYFDGVEVPAALDLGLGLATRLPFGEQLSAATARRNVRRMARQFIAGATAEEALPRLRRLWRAGEAATVDLLGERTVTDAEASRYAARVVAMLDALAEGSRDWPVQPALESDPWGPVPRASVSVKPTALSPLFAPLTAAEGLAAARARLRPLLERARAAGVSVQLDMEHDDAKDLTLALLRAVGDDFPDAAVGCVVQAYRRDAFDDLQDLAAWAATRTVPLQVRLVKGAYWDLETIVARAEGWPVPVFERKAETDVSYERCTRFLVARAGTVRPQFGSHNLRSLAHAIAAARARGLSDTAVELQLLYGMAEPVHAALRRLGFRVRAYAPVGELVPGMAYLVRRLLENTSNESFVRQRFAEGQALEELVAPPAASESAVLVARPSDPPSRPPTDPDAPGPFTNEPHAELRRPGPRARLAAAVGDAAARLGFAAPVLVAGERLATTGEMVSVDPGDPATVVCRAGRASRAEAERAVEAALAAFPAWRATPWRARAAVLFRAAARLRARREDLAALEVFEAGKPLREADADVCEAIDFCEYYGREALALAAGRPALEVPGEANAHRYQPRGVGVVIAPWNFPLAIPAGMTAAALATGNCVLLKPAEQTPGVAFRLVEAFLEAGVPPAVLAFLPGLGEDVGAHLVAHPAIAFVAFTGSRDVGLSILREAALLRPGQRHVKRVIAEMGGKNAVVVDTDADLDQAVPAIVESAFGYAGQKCSAAARVIGVGPVFDELAARLVGAAALVPVGHPRELRTVVGPLIDAAARDRLHRYRALAAEEGDVLLGRTDVPDRGWYVGPTVAVARSPDARIATEEIFGPLVTLLRADDFTHALAIANASEYALTAGIFSRSPAHIAVATAELRAGNVYVNRAITGARVGRQPFGGYGLSGVGSKAGGPDYLLQFVDPRVVSENTIRQGFAPLAPVRRSPGASE
jgi:RHH-type proline utilization regulon transcriptional repressor/proline dehydrogenase/delta 1-pyrroline-5-carboxylate dehydrogenase